MKSNVSLSITDCPPASKEKRLSALAVSSATICAQSVDYPAREYGGGTLGHRRGPETYEGSGSQDNHPDASTVSTSPQVRIISVGTLRKKLYKSARPILHDKPPASITPWSTKREQMALVDSSAVASRLYWISL
jgi:hypothetical protein